MLKLPYKSLLDDKSISVEGNEAAFENMPEVIRMFRGETSPSDEPSFTVNGKLDDIFKYVTTDMNQYDGYYIEGEMINQFIQAFPEMKTVWGKLSSNQKWIFIEGLHFGIRPFINKHMGLKQI